jgi:uridine kinase
VGNRFESIVGNKKQNRINPQFHISKMMAGSPGLVVVITGPSGSGKTSLAEAVAMRFLRSVVVSQDAFYRANLPPEVSWESPAAFDWDALSKELERQKQTRSLVLVEGFCLLASETRADVVVVLQCTRELAMARRLARDAIAKNDPANSSSYFDTVVWPAHLEYEKAHVARTNVDLFLDAALPAKELATRVEAVLRKHQERK